MKTWKLLLVLGAVAAATLSCGSDDQVNNLAVDNNVIVTPDPPRAMTIDEATRSGAVEVTVTGVDLENIHFVVRARQAVELTLPAGLMLISGDAGTQNMMTGAARTVSLNGTQDLPDVQEIVVPAYCINRFRETPTRASTFSLDTSGGSASPLGELARCIESHPAEHRAKQLAIWAVSDGFVNMDADQFAAAAVDHLRSQVIALGPNGYADKLEREGRAPPAFIAQLRGLSASDLLELFDRQASGIAAGARTEYEEIRAAARPLLAQCGYDVATLRMFAATEADETSNAM